MADTNLRDFREMLTGISEGQISGSVNALIKKKKKEEESCKEQDVISYTHYCSDRGIHFGTFWWIFYEF